MQFYRVGTIGFFYIILVRTLGGGMMSMCMGGLALINTFQNCFATQITWNVFSNILNRMQTLVRSSL